MAAVDQVTSSLISSAGSTAVAPRITGPRVFGVRPGSPVLFTVTASGAKPVRFAAANLPEGLALDPATGRLTGSLHRPGTYEIPLRVTNAAGTCERSLRLVVGEQLALTPPMGWNSWYICSEAISDQRIRAAAEAMVRSSLVDHGWTYINMDDCWQGARGGAYNALQGNEKFPDMKGLCDYVHGLGLKLGIYSTPWMGSYAGFRGGSCANPQGDYSEGALPPDQRLQPNQIYGRCPGAIDRGFGKVGPCWFGDADARQWAAWGLDMVKYDWYPNDVPTTQRLAADLRACGRDIILSLSNDSPFENFPALSQLANLWRTGPDIRDNWASISRAFEHEKWAPFAGPGHWNDMDMLQVGRLGVPNTPIEETRPSLLTPDEQYTQITLWCLLSAPLLLSCDLARLDPFTLSLLTNDDVLDIDQDPLGRPATCAARDAELEFWIKELHDHTFALGLINRGQAAQTTNVAWRQFGLERVMQVRDLWRRQDLPQAREGTQLEVPSHGSVLLRLAPTR